MSRSKCFRFHNTTGTTLRRWQEPGKDPAYDRSRATFASFLATPVEDRKAEQVRRHNERVLLHSGLVATISRGRKAVI